MKKRMKRVGMAVTALGLLTWATGRARADFLENFDNPTGANGQVSFLADATYLAAGATPSGGDNGGNSALNGFVVQNTNFAPFSTGGWGVISQDQGGSGSFLYEGTDNPGNPVGVYVGTFWESYNPVPVTPNTTYEFSFYLTNSTPRLLSTGLNPAIVQPFINGSPLGTAVSASGYYLDGLAGDGWQQFVFTWNSGSSTTADLRLENSQSIGNGDGNDFGIDTIALTAVPEPTGFMSMGAACVLCVVCSIRRRSTTPRPV